MYSRPYAHKPSVPMIRQGTGPRLDQGLHLGGLGNGDARLLSNAQRAFVTCMICIFLYQSANCCVVAHLIAHAMIARATLLATL